MFNDINDMNNMNDMNDIIDMSNNVPDIHNPMTSDNIHDVLTRPESMVPAEHKGVYDVHHNINQ